MARLNAWINRNLYRIDAKWFHCRVCGHPSEHDVDDRLTFRRHYNWCPVGLIHRLLLGENQVIPNKPN